MRIYSELGGISKFDINIFSKYIDLLLLFNFNFINTYFLFINITLLKSLVIIILIARIFFNFYLKLTIYSTLLIR